MTTFWYEDSPQGVPHWWEIVEMQRPSRRQTVRWTTSGQTLVGRVVGVQDVRVMNARAKRGRKRVYFFDADDGRKLLIWGVGSISDWFACRPALLSRRVRIRYLGPFEAQGRTHLRFSVRCIERRSQQKGR